MKIKTTSILIGMLFVTAAFLLAQALSPNTGADPLHLRSENQEWVGGLEG